MDATVTNERKLAELSSEVDGPLDAYNRGCLRPEVNKLFVTFQSYSLSSSSPYPAPARGVTVLCSLKLPFCEHSLIIHSLNPTFS